MDMQIIAIYFFADEVLKVNRFSDDLQVKMTTAEIITTVLTAARYFYGNQRRAADFLRDCPRIQLSSIFGGFLADFRFK